MTAVKVAAASALANIGHHTERSRSCYSSCIGLNGLKLNLAVVFIIIVVVVLVIVIVPS